MLRRAWLLNLILLAAIAAAGVRLSGLVRSPLPELPAAPATGEGRESGASGAVPGAAGSEAAPPAGGPPGAAGDGEYEVIAAGDLFSQARGTPPPQARSAGTTNG